MKNNGDELKETPKPVLELILQLLAILINHRKELTPAEVDLLNEAISKI